MHWLARKAYISWMDQGKRCNNINNIAYKYYGANGVKRIWSNINCINFWINEFFKREGWNKPIVSRNEDNGNYELGNVILEEHSKGVAKIKITKKMRESAKNVSIRTRSKRVKLTNIKNPTDIIEFYSSSEASRQLDKCKNYVIEAIRIGRMVIYNYKKYKPEYIK